MVKDCLHKRFITAVLDDEMTEQPLRNIVFIDFDLERVILDVLKVDYDIIGKHRELLVVKDNKQRIFFPILSIPNRHGSEIEEEIVILN